MVHTFTMSCIVAKMITLHLHNTLYFHSVMSFFFHFFLPKITYDLLYIVFCSNAGPVLAYSCAVPENYVGCGVVSRVCVCGGGGGLTTFYSQQRVFHSGPYGPPLRSNLTRV